MSLAFSLLISASHVKKAAEDFQSYHKLSQDLIQTELETLEEDICAYCKKLLERPCPSSSPSSGPNPTYLMRAVRSTTRGKSMKWTKDPLPPASRFPGSDHTHTFPSHVQDTWEDRALAAVQWIKTSGVATWCIKMARVQERPS